MAEPLDLAPIEKRAGLGTYASVTNQQRLDDTRALLAEVKRLRAQVAEGCRRLHVGERPPGYPVSIPMDDDEDEGGGV